MRKHQNLEECGRENRVDRGQLGEGVVMVLVRGLNIVYLEVYREVD